jgi:CubicO group peptidase (beta-lactamase class C family)
VTDFPRTRERLEYELDDGGCTRGAQVVVEVAGERLVDREVDDNGLGAPLTPEHILRVYCTIKPLLTIIVAQLVEDGTISLDEPLSELLPDMRSVGGGTTLRHVLTHTAGLHTLMGITMDIAPASKRRDIVSRVARPPGWRLGHDAGYSEYAGWNVIGWLVESLTGESLRTSMRRRLIEPLGLENTYVGMTHDEYNVVLPRLAVNRDLRQQGSFPMLFERSERVCSEVNPAHGGYSNARDLAHLYSALLAQLDGADNPALPTAATLAAFTGTVRAPVFDVVLDRECPFGLGFMTSLDQHAFSEVCSPRSFGHSGNVGTSFAFAEPDRALAVGVVLNGLVDYETAFLRRRALVRAIYLDADEHSQLTDDDVPEVAQRPDKPRRFRRKRDPTAGPLQ